MRVRYARVDDAAEMARVNVRSWREAYRGVMADHVLDDPGLPAARERFWTAMLSDERYRANRVAVAERGGEVIGIAMAGPSQAESQWGTQLLVLYVVAAEHGTGVGAALLDAVVGPDESAALWVADPNPRAQAFYRKQGFVADGTVNVEDGVREIRMVRISSGVARARNRARVQAAVNRSDGVDPIASFAVARILEDAAVLSIVAREPALFSSQVRRTRAIPSLRAIGRASAKAAAGWPRRLAEGLTL
ncbi:GNAT superfamily N-acetyltransferase [Arthrobacter sp. UYNi723]